MTDDEDIDDIVARLDGWSTLCDRIDGRGFDAELEAERKREERDYRQHMADLKAADDALEAEIEEAWEEKRAEMSDEDIERAKAREEQKWDEWAHSATGLADRRGA